jgi:hypothetical protein
VPLDQTAEHQIAIAGRAQLVELRGAPGERNAALVGRRGAQHAGIGEQLRDGPLARER